MKGLIERVSNPESAGESANMEVEEEEQHEEHVEQEGQVEHEGQVEQRGCNLEEDSQMEEEAQESDHNEEEAEDEEEEMVNDLLNKSLGTDADKREAERKVKA